MNNTKRMIAKNMKNDTLRNKVAFLSNISLFPQKHEKYKETNKLANNNDIINENITLSSLCLFFLHIMNNNINHTINKII